MRVRVSEDPPSKQNSRELPRELMELSMRKLGVQVVWCKDYGDVRDCLRELKERGMERSFGRRAAPCSD